MSRRSASPITKRDCWNGASARRRLRRFLGRLPKDNWLEVPYSAFVADRLETSERLTEFLCLTPEQTLRDFTLQNVRRSSESRDGAELTQHERLIGGPLLEQSVQPLRSGLTASGDPESVSGHQRKVACITLDLPRFLCGRCLLTWRVALARV